MGARACVEAVLASGGGVRHGGGGGEAEPGRGDEGVPVRGGAVLFGAYRYARAPATCALNAQCARCEL